MQYRLSGNLPRPSVREPPLKSLRLSSLRSGAGFQDPLSRCFWPAPSLRDSASKTLLSEAFQKISVSQPSSYIYPDLPAQLPPSPIISKSFTPQNLPHPKIFHTPKFSTTMSPRTQFTLLTVPTNLWYLAPGMPIRMVNISNIKKILDKHGVNHSTCSVKAHYEAIFEDEIAKNRAALYAQEEAKASGMQVDVEDEIEAPARASRTPRRHQSTTPAPHSPMPAPQSPDASPAAPSSRQASMDVDVLGPFLSKFATQLSTVGDKLEIMENNVNKDMDVMRGAIEAIAELQTGGGKGKNAAAGGMERTGQI
ncbi:hypothetical protein BDR22DRAFT_917661 [Usnea florida]